ncbi:DUF2470 domain-containing protein [Sinosporangium siamense]|uniref:DUF2470 domain-containing protein n=1 Tax=Sinosporangium siamense TaxID=1367973 RepID=A0A919V674_9ACTN|nr:DUF2470 domain-containing protein [Sinosporangium siamense]GII93765.1 hypothetical protein Ssi02_39960 [Sinosporangium siamense]
MQQPLTAPPIPERIRSLAAVAVPGHVSVAGSDAPAGPARGGVDAKGRPVLLVRPGEPLHAAPGETVVTVDLTATRDLGAVEQPRGLLKVQGWAEEVPAKDARAAAVAVAERCPDEGLFEALERRGDPGAPRLLRVDVGQVIYLTGGDSGVLDACDYLDAEPDPFLDAAESMIHHVNSAHRAQIRTVVASLMGEPAPESWLWELDRFGATLRVGVDRPTLIRLPWPEPATSCRALEKALRCLLCR